MRFDIRQVFLCLVALLALAGCDTSPPPLLRVAVHVWPGYESLYLARNLGLYDEAPIRLVEASSATSASEALRSGIVEAAALTLDEALTLMQDGIDLKVVLVMDASQGADKLLAHSGIDRLDDLRGKRVCVENGAVGALLLQAALDQAHLKPGDIRLVPLAIDQQLEAWRAGSVDAVVSFDPVAREIEKQGGKVLFDSRRIPGRILDVLVIRADALPRHSAVLKTLIAGHFAALQRLAHSPGEAHERMARRLHVPAAEVAALFSGIHLPDVAENHDYLDGPSPQIEVTTENLADLMLCRHLLRERPGITGIATSDFLPKVRP